MQSIAKVVLVTVLLSSSVIAEDVDQRLLGKWRSDATKTMQFNKEYVRLEKGQIVALEQMFGKLTLEITRTHFNVEVPAYSIIRNGKTIEMEATRERVPYTVIGQTTGAVATKTTHKDAGQFDELAIWHVEGNSMWKYVGDSPFGWFHMREYFTRLEPDQK